ncbi:MAG: DUF1592 domain-containing protein [Deltaproteobacteria bacterium]|nr:DUF1592 domain-containing protein [Deltaproteobacteria bacterium]
MTRLPGISLGLCAALALAACAQPAEGLLTPLDARAQLIRVKVDLLGVHPDEVELVAIEEEPELYPLFVDRYLDDERFLERFREVYDTRLLMRNGMDGAEEPLRLLSHIIENDLPFSEFVTADYTIANEGLAAMYGITLAGDAGWQAGWYEDGRPHSGVITMTSLWQRYPSAGMNANRHRANALSRLLLCDDYLDRPIAFSRNAVDQIALSPEESIRSSADCTSCHSTLDPLAAHFYGFYSYEEDDFADPLLYRPENEELWRDYADVAPAYYGQPTSSLVDLGQQVAQDPRFVDCAVKTVWEGFTQRSYEDADWTEIQTHRSAFMDSGLRVRELMASIANSNEYRAGYATERALSERLSTVRVVSPAQLASIVEQLTGYRWSFGGEDGLTNPNGGLITLAGGIDADSVTQPTRAPSVSLLLVHERLAQAAAAYVVANDLASDREGEAKLLGAVTRDDRPEGEGVALFEAQVRHLYLVVTGYPLPEDSTDPAALVDLWKQVYSVDASANAAWTGVVTAVLRDPAVITY